MEMETLLTVVFGVVVIGFLVADLGFFNKKSHKIDFKQALIQSLFWVGVSLVFALLIFFFIDKTTAIEFLSAYVTEKMLSVDNLFVIMLIFSYFKLEEKYHHRVLFWGICGAIVFRGIFIATGSYIIEQFHWVLYIFGLVLLYTGVNLLRNKKEEHINIEKSKIMKFLYRFLPFTDSHHNGKFFVREQGKFYFTSLFMIVALVEFTDIIFAVDSIPAVFSISQNIFVVFTSNIFAIMGLRALFFLLENILHRFHHLQKGLAFILLFIGGKMLAGIFDIHISSLISFVVILSALFLSILGSFMYPKKHKS